jgi:LacI family transcriptional regulator
MAEARVITIHDVAKRAGVAVSSVSRALSNHPDVSERMRVRVQRAADALGYAPDPVAQSLRSGSSRTIGLVVRDFANPLFAEIIYGAERTLTDAGYMLLVMNSGGDSERERERIALLGQRRVDALLLSSISEIAPATLKTLGRFRKPVVLLDRDLGKLAVSDVGFDHANGVREATGDLLALGHRQIALVTGSPEIRPTRERLRGFRQAYDEAGAAVSPDMEITGVFSESFAREKTMQLLQLPARSRPTALIAGGIQSTVGMLEGLSEMSLRPGGDVALVVCDDLPWLRVLRPAISVVSRDAEGMGVAAANQVLRSIAGEGPGSVLLPTTYSRRDTSTPAPVKRLRAHAPT